MPENAILDLVADDITQPTWDELTRAMLDGDDSEMFGDSCTTTFCSGDFTWEPY